MFKRLLVALSGTEFTPVAVRYAVELAQRHGAHVTGVTLEDVRRIEGAAIMPIGGGAAARSLAHQREEEIRARIAQETARFRATCRDASVDPTVLHHVEDTVVELERLCRYQDLAILGLRGLFGYGVMDTPPDIVAQILARRVFPLMTVPETYRPVKRALIAYNGSPESARAMKSFVRAGLWPEVSVTILVMNHDRDAQQLLTEAEEYCAAYGVRPRLEHAPTTSPREKLMTIASELESDILVMGSRSKTHLRRLVLGSMTSLVLAHAQIPLYLTF